MSGTLEEREKHHWRDFVKPCRIPLMNMFGRQPRLPIDLVVGIHPRKSNHKSYLENVKTLHQHLQDKYTYTSTMKMGEKNKI